MADHELVIVGGGAAGLAAGLQAARARIDTVLFERMGPGGQLLNIDRVENYPGFPQGISGQELGPLMAEQAMDAGLAIELAEVDSIAADADGGYVLSVYGEPTRARAVILAMGSTLAKLGVPGEAEHEGHGVSYCATCDGSFFHGQPVVVAGGGDSALDEALYLLEIASSVTIVHRRDAFRAERVAQERVLTHRNCSVVWNSTVTRIAGENGTVHSVEVSGNDGGVKTIAASGVFVYVGLNPATSFLDGFVKLDGGGHIIVGPNLETSAPGVFAAGDLRQHSSRQLASAAGDGATAAIHAERLLRGQLAR